MRTFLTIAMLLPLGQAARLDAKAIAKLAAERSVAKEDSVFWDRPTALNKNSNFTFMTNDFSYPGHVKGGFGSGGVPGWYEREISDTVRDEIAKGHSCAKRGSRDETYYATSFCYWLPSFRHPTANKESGLQWIGGMYARGKNMCEQGLSGKGKCMKCSICHNNARDVDGGVDKTTFSEELPLPGDCLTEEAVEHQCVTAFESEQAPLKAEKELCETLQRRYDEAITNHENVRNEMEELPRLISDELPAQIRVAEGRVSNLETRMNFDKQIVKYSREEMSVKCASYQKLVGQLWWYPELLDSSLSTEELLTHVEIQCSMPLRPGQGAPPSENTRYEEELSIYNACQPCQTAKASLTHDFSRLQDKNASLVLAKARVAELGVELKQARTRLEQLSNQIEDLENEKANAEATWIPRKEQCLRVYEEFKGGKAASVRACVPQHWHLSCEKACLEAQGDFGCGIIEGSQISDVTKQGGLSVTCSPPQPSWMAGPWTWNSTVESQSEQCKRIVASQQPIRATNVVKAGWLWKQSSKATFRWSGWEKRYFVLESGNRVRSAVLRYFEREPDKIEEWSQIAREEKALILWDARYVKTKPGWHYGFNDNTACFKLYHYYRDYRLCIPGDGLDEYQVNEQREEWIALLRSTMIWPQ